MDFLDFLRSLFDDDRAVTTESAQRRLRGAYSDSGPLWDAPHVKGLPMSMVPRHLDHQRWLIEMSPLIQFLQTLGRT